jgi:hypothetical protein
MLKEIKTMVHSLLIKVENKYKIMCIINIITIHRQPFFLSEALGKKNDSIFLQQKLGQKRE